MDAVEERGGRQNSRRQHQPAQQNPSHHTPPPLAGYQPPMLTASKKVRMLRCASSFVVAAYAKVRLTPQGSRALPAAFLRSRPIFTPFKAFYAIITSDGF